MDGELEVITHDDDYDDDTKKCVQCNAAKTCSRNIQITTKSVLKLN